MLIMDFDLITLGVVQKCPYADTNEEVKIESECDIVSSSITLCRADGSDGFVEELHHASSIGYAKPEEKSKDRIFNLPSVDKLSGSDILEFGIDVITEAAPDFSDLKDQNKAVQAEANFNQFLGEIIDNQKLVPIKKINSRRQSNGGAALRL